MTPAIAALSDQAGAAPPSSLSPRLDAVIALLPLYQRSRMACGLDNAGVRTLTELCATPRTRLHRLKNVGERSIASLEDVLSMLGLGLAERTRMPIKTQTPAQRVANPVWLRQQITTLVADCEAALRSDQAAITAEPDATRRARYEARIDCQRHWKRKLERIRGGQPAIDDLAYTLIEQGVQP